MSLSSLDGGNDCTLKERERSSISWTGPDSQRIEDDGEAKEKGR